MRIMTKMILVLTVVAMLMLTACEVQYQPVPQSTQKVEQNLVESNQEKLTQNQPIPTITRSLERENIINRLKVLNDDSKVFYVYLVSYGKVMAFYTAKGKVSSLNSYLNSQERVVKDENCIQAATRNPSYESIDYAECFFNIDTPDIDGSYGVNADGVFFFTTEGAYVEWKGEYLASDQPLKLSTPVELVKEVK